MKIVRDAVAGTLESGDALVRVFPSDELEVVVTTNVEAQYGPVVRQTVSAALAGLGVDAGIVNVVDKGALDCALRARVQAAVARGSDEPIDWPKLIGDQR